MEELLFFFAGWGFQEYNIHIEDPKRFQVDRPVKRCKLLETELRESRPRNVLENVKTFSCNV
jgi:hypothetical protein